MKTIKHIYNRGVEKRIIFLDSKDYYRFLVDLYIFNDKSPTPSTSSKSRKLEPGTFVEVEPRRKPLVEIGAFVLMPNHYHLLLREVVENGIAFFMQKLGTGYTMYFNQKYNRVGSLFQGRYKSTELENDSQVHYLPHYIHANPIKLIDKNWKDKKIKNLTKVTKFLENYRWSSLGEFLNKESSEFNNITSKKLIRDISVKNYPKDFKSWLKELSATPPLDLPY